MSTHEPNCEWVRDRIDAFIDGNDSDLTAGERNDVKRHTTDCAACAEDLALAQRMGAELRAMAIPSAPAPVVDRALADVTDTRGRVVRLHPRARWRRWIPATVAAALLVAAVSVEQNRRRAAEAAAVEHAARETAVAFAYLNKYARRAGDIVEDEVIEQRLMAPVEKVMEKSGVTETKTDAGQS